MNERQILQVLAQFGVSNLSNALTAGVTVLLARNPAATDAELLSEESGTTKHAVRKKIGWLVDLIWPEVEAYVDQAIRSAIVSVRVEMGRAASTSERGVGHGENI